MLNYRFVARANKSAEMYLYDSIGASMWSDGGITSKQVVDDLAKLGTIDNLTVRINSPGGDVFDGLAIYNALARHPANVRVEVDAIAGSIASIIAMAGKTIAMAENATMMLHDPSGFVVGTAEQMHKTADALDGVRNTLVKTYAKRSGMSESKASDLMSAESWLDCAQCMDLGLCDEMSQPMQLAACAGLERFYRNVPPHLVGARAEVHPVLSMRSARILQLFRLVAV